MPVILPEAAWADWLDRDNQDREQLDSLLTVYPAEQIGEHPVATLVNKVTNNFPSASRHSKQPPSISCRSTIECSPT